MCTKQQLIKILNKGYSLMTNFWWKRRVLVWGQARCLFGQSLSSCKETSDLQKNLDLCFVSPELFASCALPPFALQEERSAGTLAFCSPGLPEPLRRAVSWSVQIGCGHQLPSLGAGAPLLGSAGVSVASALGCCAQ